MNRIYILSIFIFLLSSCIQEEKENKSPGNKVVAGDLIPEFTIYNNNGETFSSASFTGKKGILFFFSVSCSDCQREFPKIEEVWQAFKDDENFTMAAISRGDKAESIANYWHSHNLSLPYYLDPDKSVFNLFAEYYVPRLYLIDSQGIISWMGIETITPTTAELIEKINTLR